MTFKYQLLKIRVILFHYKTFFITADTVELWLKIGLEAAMIPIYRHTLFVDLIKQVGIRIEHLLALLDQIID